MWKKVAQQLSTQLPYLLSSENTVAIQNGCHHTVGWQQRCHSLPWLSLPSYQYVKHLVWPWALMCLAIWQHGNKKKHTAFTIPGQAEMNKELWNLMHSNPAVNEMWRKSLSTFGRCHLFLAPPPLTHAKHGNHGMSLLCVPRPAPDWRAAVFCSRFRAQWIFAKLASLPSNLLTIQW